MLKKIKIKLNISWTRFYEQCKKDFKLWCYFVLFQQLCRVYLIFSLRSYISEESSILDILTTMLHGLRFDSLWATCWLFFSLGLFTLPSFFIDISKRKKRSLGIKKTSSFIERRRQYLGGIFTVVTALMYISGIEYFKEYQDVFNQFLFGWFTDDKTAILKTIYDDYHVFEYLTALILLLWVYIKFSNHLLYRGGDVVKESRKHSLIYKIFFFIVLVCFYIVGFRGLSIGPRPIQEKDSDVTQDVFLNKAVVSPYSFLKYAIDDHHDSEIQTQDISDLSIEDVRLSARKYFDKTQNYSLLSQYMKRKANGPMLKKPKHIFLIIAESIDAWPLQDQYKELGVTENLRKIIKDGVFFKNFISSTGLTIGAINTVITGIPDMGLLVNHQKTARSLYPTSIAKQFKNLGFKTQVFYGGDMNWRRLEDFSLDQGFDKFYGAGSMMAWNQKRSNCWGTDDRSLFRFVLDSLRGEKESTFNIIITCSNHPPFSIDLEKEGFPKDKVLKSSAKYPKGNENIKELGHIWYSDQTIGEFVEDMREIDDNSLFVITGDHYGRRHVLPNPPLYDVSSVPLIIYGKEIEKYCNKNNCKKFSKVAGAHLDIGATLIELIAPKGFVYHAVGDSLFSKRKFNLGIDKNNIITDDFIADINSDKIMYFTKHKGLAAPQKLKSLKERFKWLNNIVRYMVVKGDELYEDKANPKSD